MGVVIKMLKQQKDEVENKKFEDLTEKQKKIIKEITLARLKQIPDNFRLSIG